MEFHRLFRAALERQKMTQAALAEASGDYDSNVNAVLQGKRPPPLHRLARWADLLQLDGAERFAFFSAGVHRNLPPELQAAHAKLTREYPATAGFFAEHDPAVLRSLAQTQAHDDQEKYDADLMLPVSGRAAAAQGAHVDGETVQPDPIRIRSRWRVHVIHGTSGGAVVLPGQSVITDPALDPKRNRLVVIPTADGPILKRWGERHDDSVVVSSVNGLDPQLVPLAELGKPEVVVGVLFTDSVAG